MGNCDRFDLRKGLHYTEEAMKHNVGGIDRAFRIGIGFPALSVVVATDDWLLKIIFGVVAAGGIITWALGYCPINDALGRSTVKQAD